MSFIRPEIREEVSRWREVIAMVLLLGFGAWLFLRQSLFLQGVGLAIMLVATGLTLIAARRVMFRTGKGGPGVVQLDEGRISYFGPFYGGSVSLDSLTRLELGQTADGKKMWYLHNTTDAALVVPAAAKGADVLYDAFIALPGLDPDHLVRATHHNSMEQIVVWQRPGGLH